MTHALGRALTFRRLKYASFAHSAAYVALLTAAALPGAQAAETVFGWAHGVGWIVMSLLVVTAVRLRVIPLWLGVVVAIVGGVGPFAGSAGFVWQERHGGEPTR